MWNWGVIFAPVALFLPTALTVDSGEAHALGKPKAIEQVASAELAPLPAFQPWEAEPLPQQVRIEQRMVVRISPARPRTDAFEDLRRSVPTRMSESRMGKCVGLDDIVAVQTGNANRLILFMRNRQMISAQLEKACAARDFYSGFYVEPSKDGNLCVNRDELHSRNGTKCEVTRFYRLEAVRD